MITLETLKERPLSYSSLKEFSKSPAHYINYLNKPRETTPALQFGSLLHLLLLEPQEFDNVYAVSPKFDMRKTADKEAYAEFQAKSEGKEIIPETLLAEVHQLAELVKDNPMWRVAVEGASFEQKDTIEIYDLPFVRIRDIVKSDLTIDVKTVQSGYIDDIIKDFYNHKYYLQAAIYGEPFSFYVVEKSAPFDNGLIGTSQEFIDYGKRELEKLCMGFNLCLSNPELFNKGYEFWYEIAGIKPIVKLPKWVINVKDN